MYDGHGGERAAVFASAAMQARLQASPGFGKRDYAAGLLQAFSEVERDFLALAERDGLSDGTTAVVALVEPTVLTVAHVGDSRGVLCRGGAAVPITDDHKPEVASSKPRLSRDRGRPRLRPRRPAAGGAGGRACCLCVPR